MVFPHRACGFAAGATPIPVCRWDLIKSLKPNDAVRRRDKVAAGGTPAAPAVLADWSVEVVEDEVHPALELFVGDAPVGRQSDSARARVDDHAGGVEL